MNKKVVSLNKITILLSVTLSIFLVAVNNISLTYAQSNGEPNPIYTNLEFLEYSDWMGIPIQPYPISLDRFKSLLLDAVNQLAGN